MAERSKRGSGVVGSIQPVPIIPVSKGPIFRDFAGILSGLARKASDRADILAVEKANEQGVLAGATGNFQQRSPLRLSGRAFNEAGAATLRAKLDSDFKVKLQQSEAQHGSDMGAFTADMDDFVTGQLSEVEGDNPEIAAHHGISIMPSYTSAQNRVQRKKNAVMDDKSVADLRTFSEAIQRENTVAARGLSSADPAEVQDSADILVENFLKLQERYANPQTNGDRVVSEDQAAQLNIAYIQRGSEDALRGMIDNSPDIDQLMTDLESGKLKIPFLETGGDTPEVLEANPFEVLPRERVEAIIRYGHAVRSRRAREQDSVSAQVSFQTKQQVGDAIAQNGFSGDGSLPSDEGLSQVYGEEQILVIKDQFETAGISFSLRQTLVGASQDQRLAVLETLNERVKDPGSFRTDRKMQEEGLKINAKIEAELDRDSAAFVMSSDPLVQRAGQQLEASPESFPQFLDQVVEAQIRQGVGSSETRITTNAQAEGFAGRLNDASDGFEFRQIISELSSQYGEHAPQLINEMVVHGGANRFLGVVANLPLNNPAAGFFVELIMGNISETDLQDSVAADATDIRDRVNTVIEDDFAPYLPPGNIGVREQYRDSLRLLSYHLMSTEGSSEKSVERAWKILVEDQYEFPTESVRVPKAESDDSVDRGLFRVGAVIDSIASDIKVKDIASIDERRNQDEDSREGIDAEYIELLKHSSVFFTNHDETGINVHDLDQVPVVDDNGEPITITWEELRNLGVGPVQSQEPLGRDITGGGRFRSRI